MTPDVTAYYEPLHPLLPSLIAGPRWVDRSHRGISDYFTAYRQTGFDPQQLGFSPAFAANRVHLSEDADYFDLQSYLQNLIDSASTKVVVLQFNRCCYRMGWLKQHFPQSTIISLHRNPADQYASMRRLVAPAHRDAIRYDMFGILTELNSLLTALPAAFEGVAATDLRDLFSRMWCLHRREAELHADRIIDYERLLSEPADIIAELARVGVLQESQLAGYSRRLAPPPACPPTSRDAADRRYFQQQIVKGRAITSGVASLRELEATAQAPLNSDLLQQVSLGLHLDRYADAERLARLRRSRLARWYELKIINGRKWRKLTDLYKKCARTFRRSAPMGENT